jgi:hypothetical protein
VVVESGSASRRESLIWSDSPTPNLDRRAKEWKPRKKLLQHIGQRAQKDPSELTLQDALQVVFVFVCDGGEAVSACLCVLVCSCVCAFVLAVCVFVCECECECECCMRDAVFCRLCNVFSGAMPHRCCGVRCPCSTPAA